MSSFRPVLSYPIPYYKTREIVPPGAQKFQYSYVSQMEISQDSTEKISQHFIKKMTLGFKKRETEIGLYSKQVKSCSHLVLEDCYFRKIFSAVSQFSTQGQPNVLNH